MTKIFVYGTLMNGFYNHFRLKDAIFVSRTTINYKGVMFSFGGFPAIIDDETERTLHGEVYEVDEATLQSCDQLEGHPNWYRRVPVKTADGQDVEVYAQKQKENESYYKGVIVENGDWLDFCKNQKNSVSHFVKNETAETPIIEDEASDPFPDDEEPEGDFDAEDDDEPDTNLIVITNTGEIKKMTPEEIKTLAKETNEFTLIEGSFDNEEISGIIIKTKTEPFDPESMGLGEEEL